MSWSLASQKKIILPDQLIPFCQNLRETGYTIATLNGSFDLLHAGHLHILYEAANQADKLIVALNSDASIKKYKSLDRPIISLSHRLSIMAALEFVDYVTWFEETDPCLLLEKIKPDVHVNGSEYGENCIEASLIKSQGGRLHLVSLVQGLSTSTIIRKIQEGNLCV